jgi:acetyltransferase-like isoleucine patch superfamily enzyme
LVGNHYVFGDHFYCGREVIFGGGPRSHFEVGKYSSVATRSSFLMGQGNHRPQSLSSFPFGHAPCFDDSQWTQSFDYEKESTTYCKLGNDVWIGVGTIVLPNVTIGDGAIVSAGSVVKEDVPAYSVVGGNPAQVISFRFKQELIQELVEMKWWDWPVEKINRNKELFTKNLITRKSLNKVSVYD